MKRVWWSLTIEMERMVDTELDERSVFSKL